jgi:ubiquitin C-terminal hydrolase
LNRAFAELINNFSQKQLQTFVRIFINEDSKFYLGEQHDSPEFISDCLNNLGYGTSRKCYEYYDTTIEDNKGKLSWNRLLQKETSIITDLFYGQLKHESICLNSSCNNKNRFYEEYLLLDIPIPKKGVTFKLFSIGDYTKYKEVYIEYANSDDKMTVKHVKDCVHNKYAIHVDVVQLTQNEITVLTNDDDSFVINKDYEFVLYEIKNKDIRRCYIVKCKKRNKSKSWFACCCKREENYIESFIEYPTLEFENNESIQKINFNPNINDYYIKVNSSQDEYQKIKNKNDVFHETENKINILYLFENKNKRLNIEQNDNTKLTLDICFDLFKNSTTKIKCKTCQHVCKLKTSFTKLPHYLIVYFKRFTLATNSSFKKRNELIDFPEELTLNENDNNNNNEVTYKAFSIVYHYGSISSGHYTALCKEGNTWYYYDDSRSPKEKNFNVTGNELLVFYEKQLK